MNLPFLRLLGNPLFLGAVHDDMIFRLSACAQAGRKQQDESLKEVRERVGKKPESRIKTENLIMYLLLTEISTENRKKSMCLPAFHPVSQVLNVFINGTLGAPKQ